MMKAEILSKVKRCGSNFLAIILLLSVIVSMGGCSASKEKSKETDGSSTGIKSSSGSGKSNSSSGKSNSSKGNNSGGSGSDDYLISRNSVFFYDGTDAFFVGLVGSEIFEVSKDPTVSYRATLSLYGDKAVIFPTVGKSYYFTGSEPVLIDDDIYDICISADGSACAYVKYDENSVSHLYWYSNGVSEQIMTDIDKFCISFDGKYVGYTLLESSGNYHSYLWDHGVIDLGTEKYLLAVSTDAKYIYYSTDALGERDFCIQLGPTSDTVIEFAHYGYDNAPDLVFNYDGSEVILDRLYGWDELYIKGEKSARMSGTTFFPNTAIWRSNGSPSASVFSANVKTYANGLYYIYDSPLISFYFIGNNGIIEDFAIDVYKSGATPVKGNSEIICRVDDRIIRYIEKGGKVSEETLVSQNATDLSVAEDGSRFYYQDNNHALYLVEGKKKAKLVAEAVDEWPYGFRLFGNKVFNNKYVYYLSNGNLYCADGDQTQKIDVLNGTLKELHLESSFVWIITTLDRRDCVYYSSDGLNFRQLE